MLAKGQRVQLHAATSEWMQGDRYGIVLGYGRPRAYVRTDSRGINAEIVLVKPVRVKLDSGRVRRFHPENLWAVS